MRILLKDVVVDYELGPEYFPTVVKKDVRLADGKTILKAKMNEPDSALQGDGQSGRTEV